MLEADIQTLGPMQVIPPGLMGFLQLKQTGRLPGDLSGTVEPIIELRDWYFQARMIDVFSQFPTFPSTVTITTGSIGYKPFTVPYTWQVPASEIWYVDTYTVAIGPVASGDSVSFACAWKNGPSGTAFESTYDIGNEVNNVADATARFPAAFARNFWLPPGAFPTVRVRQITTVAGFAFYGQMRYVRLPI